MSVWDSTLYLRLLSPLFLIWVAWVMTRSPFQQRLNRLLAAFLALVSVGFVLEFLWILTGQNSPSALASEQSPFRVLQRAAGLVDPPVLLAYALSVPRIRTIRGSRALWGGYGVAILVLFVAGFPGGPLGSMVSHYSTVETAYVNGTYLAAFLLLLGSYGKEQHPHLARQLFFLSIAVGFIALSRSAAFTGFLSPTARLAGETAWLSGLIIAILILAVIAVGDRLRNPSAYRTRRRIYGALTLALVPFFLAWGAMSLSVRPGLEQIYSYFYTYRWVVFALLLGYGVLRFQLFDFEVRRRQAFVFLAAVVVGMLAAMIVADLAYGRGFSLPAARVAGLAAGAGIGFVAYAGVQVLLRRWSPVEPDPVYYAERRAEIYAAALEYALQKSTWSEEDKLFVETLREVFEISLDEHTRILARIQARLPKATSSTS